MTLIVPFDGSNLSKAALVRAAQFDNVLEEGVVVVSVIPKNNTRYARDRGWLDDPEPFDVGTIVSHLRSEVSELVPEAEFHYEFVDRYAPPGTIAGRIRKFIRTHDATIVVIGSENAGRVVSGITVGRSVAGDRSYDTLIVSNEILPEIEKLEEELPSEDVLS